MFLCSDLGLFTSTNTATGCLQEKILILLNLQFLTGNYRNWHAVVQYSLVCLVLTAELPGSPLSTELKPSALSWCEHCCWHNCSGGGSPWSHLYLQRDARCQLILGEHLQRGSHQHQRDLSLWKWWHRTHQTGLRTWPSWGMADMESARETD